MAVKPYTYLIQFTHPVKKYKKFYYGVRLGNRLPSSEDLFKVYFTSCSHIRFFIEEYGLECFEFEVRREFDSKEKAVDWEYKIKSRLRLKYDDRWFNQDMRKTPIRVGPTTDSHRDNLSKAQKDRVWIYHPATKQQKHPIAAAVASYIEGGWIIGRPPGSLFPNGHPMQGKKHSEESKKKMGPRGHKLWPEGRTFSEDHLAKIKLGLKGKGIGNNHASKPIVLNGIFYPSISAASRSLNVSRTKIYDLLKSAVCHDQC